MKGLKHKNTVGWSQKNYFFKVLSSFSNETDITVLFLWVPPEIFWAL